MHLTCCQSTSGYIYRFTEISFYIQCCRSQYTVLKGPLIFVEWPMSLQSTSVGQNTWYLFSFSFVQTGYRNSMVVLCVSSVSELTSLPGWRSLSQDLLPAYWCNSWVKGQMKPCCYAGRMSWSQEKNKGRKKLFTRNVVPGYCVDHLLYNQREW